MAEMTRTLAPPQVEPPVRAPKRRPAEGRTTAPSSPGRLGGNSQRLRQLQRAAGNQVVGRLLEGAGAGRVVGPETQENGVLQLGPATQAVLRNPGGGRPLPPSTRATVERALGVDLSSVQIHLDALAQAAAEELNVEAFTVGQDVYFGRGTSALETTAGCDIIAQELLHPLQLEMIPTDLLVEETVEVEEIVAEEVSLEPLPEAEVELEEAGPEEAPPEPEREAAEKPAEEAEGEEEKPEGEGAVEAAAEGVEAPASARPDIELIMPEPPAELSPESQARVTRSQRAATRAGRAVRDLPSAAASTTAAREAVSEPEQETTARAESRLADALGTRPEPSPEIVELCEAIRKSIREKRPVDEDELVEAEPEKMAAEAGRELNDSVEGDTERVQGSYDELNEPQTGTPQLTPEEIKAPPEEAAAPEIGAGEAAPDPIPAEDVSLDADLGQADADIEAAGMNTEPAQLVQEGPIAEARAARGELSEKAQTSPAEVLAKQEAALQAASADMVALQEQALAALSSSRAGTVSGVGAQQHKMVGTEQQMREQLSTRGREIFRDAQTRVNALLKPLPKTAMEKWEAGVARLAGEFRRSLDEVKRWIDERHSGVGGFFVSIGDYFTGLPGWVTEAYDRAEKEFGDGICALIQEISADVNSVIATCEVLIDDARQETDDLFSQKMPASLREWAAAERARIHGQLDGLQKKVTATRDDFNRDLSRRAVRAVREVQDEVQQLREEAKGLIGRIADAINEFLDDPVKFIIEGLLKLVGISPASFWALAAKVQQVLNDIADDPEKFINNLVGAVGTGFQQFFDNIGQHLLRGFLDWLFDGLVSAGVELPTDLSPRSIVTFFLQLMGITWAKIREILVRHIGAENVALIEKAWGIISTLIEKGPAGIFELIKDRLDPKQILKQVMDAAIDYLISALIKNVTMRVIALFNPVGAIIQAIELIYKVLKWIFENAAKLFSFIETIVNGMADIIAGNIGGMANAVEKALGKLIPPVIDFFASLIGVGDLPEKVVETVKKLQGWVESILDRVIGWLVEKGKKLLAAVGLGGEEKEGAEVREGDTVLGTSVAFSAAGEAHRQWVDIRGTDAILMVASNGPQPVEEKLKDWESRLDEQFGDNKEGRKEAAGLISSARALLGQADSEADALVTAFQRANAIREREEIPEIPSDDPLEAKQQALSSVLGRLFELFGEAPEKPSERWGEQLAALPASVQQWAATRLDQNEEQVRGLNEWAHVRKWLERHHPLSNPLGGSLANNFWAIVAATSRIVADGRNRNFAHPEYFGLLEKQELASVVAAGGTGDLGTRLLDHVFVGRSINANATVRAFVRDLDSSKISHETGAAGRSAPYHQFGKWDGSSLDYAYPKHVSWKDTDLSPAAWQRQGHHIWPTYLMGPDILVPIHQKLHAVHFHRIDAATIPPALGLSGRSSAAVRTAYLFAQQMGQENAFIQTVRVALIAAYNQFQNDHVVSGSFVSYCIGVISSLQKQDLNTP